MDGYLTYSIELRRIASALKCIMSSSGVRTVDANPSARSAVGSNLP